jgi:uncharacterized protein (UPF0264 family)
MRLLVSVTHATEVPAALDGGADLIDAKDVSAGALGVVTLSVLRTIRACVAGARPVSAALGDARDEDAIEQLSCEFASAGAQFVKVGFGGITHRARIAALTAAAVRGAKAGSGGEASVVAVAYADADGAMRGAPFALADAAASAGASGVLLDTADKDGPGLRSLMSADNVRGWVTHAHGQGLFVALAGRLTAADLPFARDAGADIAGVRGAACEGGRTGRVSATHVRALYEGCARPRSGRDASRVAIRQGD